MIAAAATISAIEVAFIFSRIERLFSDRVDKRKSAR